jgi:tryptophanyl-tRNA synthetase
MIKHVIEDLAPFREKRAHYQDKPGEVEEILESGTRQAQSAAAATMTEVRGTLGL